MPIDLHVHSAASDGTDSPAALVTIAADAGLDVFALTDHDTVAGHAEAVSALEQLAASGRQLTMVPGAEISCAVDGITLHMLGYLFDPTNEELAGELDLLRTDRLRRAKAMVGKLVELGVPISWEQVAAIAGTAAVGRPHVAQAMIAAGVLPDVSAAFVPDWIGNGGRAYVEKYSLDRPRRHRDRPSRPRRRNSGPAPSACCRSPTSRNRLQRLPRSQQVHPDRREHDRSRGLRGAGVARIGCWPDNGGGVVSSWLDARFFGEVFITLLVIMDPPGSVPIFLSLTATYSTKSRRRSADLAVLVAFGVIVVFALFGQQVLEYLHVTLPALQVAGGLLLLLVALQLLMGWGTEPEMSEDVNVAMVPLGTPLLAGPGAIAATIVFAKDVHHEPTALALALAIVAVHVVLWLTLRFSSVILKVIGRSGVTLVTRIAGLLLSAIAVQLGADGVRAFIVAH
jgi:multiple antibiotic resistance protein